MEKEDLKNVKEYKYLQKNAIFGIIAMSVLIVAMSLSTIPLWFNGKLTKGVVAVIILIVVVVLVTAGPLTFYYAGKLLKIKRHVKDYIIIDAKVSTSYFSYNGVLSCTAYPTDNQEPVDFNVHVNMYDHGIEVKNGDAVQLWYNEANGSVLFDSKK